MKRRKSVVKQRRNNKDLFWCGSDLIEVIYMCGCFFLCFLLLGRRRVGEGIRDFCILCNVIWMISMGFYPVGGDFVSLCGFWVRFSTCPWCFCPILCFVASCQSIYTILHYHQFPDSSDQNWYRKRTYHS